MDANFLVRGLVIGFSIAAPVGPVGVLCIRRTIAEGRRHGYVSGLGAATADAIYGCIAAFGLTFISTVLISQQTLLRLVGGFFLCFLGVRALRSKPVEQANLAETQSLIRAYGSTFFLTLTNPLTILSFAAIFAGVGIVNTSTNYASAALLVLGVFLGSVMWWLVLSGGVSLFRAKFKPVWMLWVNRISGTIIFGFGVSVLASLII